MKINLDKISEWTLPGFKLGSLAYQYAPINAKNHFARGKDEFVIWCSNDGGNYGILLIKGEQSTFIPSPVQKKKWNNRNFYAFRKRKIPCYLQGGWRCLCGKQLYIF